MPGSCSALALVRLYNAKSLHLNLALKQVPRGQLMTLKETLEIVSMIASTFSAIGTVVAVGFAAVVYYRNSAFERAKWASALYEKFYEETTLKQLRDRLDCLKTRTR